MERYKRKFKETEDAKVFECIQDGVIEIIQGHEAYSMEAKKGDIFIVDASFRKGEDQYRYYGHLVLKNKVKFMHNSGLSGKKVDTTQLIDSDKIFVAIQKRVLDNVEDDFWALFKERNN